MASQHSSYLPPGDGLLPKWLLLVASISSIYTIQSWISLRGAREVYAGPGNPVTPLSARTFGTWTALSSIVRLYAAYNIDNKVAYELCMISWGIALAHFSSEWLIYGTAKLSGGLISPFIIAGVSLTWMLSQWGWYVN